MTDQACYICLERCDTISPCACEAVVHDHCLAAYRQEDHTTCSICKSQFTDLSSSEEEVLPSPDEPDPLTYALRPYVPSRRARRLIRHQRQRQRTQKTLSVAIVLFWFFVCGACFGTNDQNFCYDVTGVYAMFIVPIFIYYLFKWAFKC